MEGVEQKVVNGISVLCEGTWYLICIGDKVFQTICVLVGINQELTVVYCLPVLYFKGNICLYAVTAAAPKSSSVFQVIAF